MDGLTVIVRFLLYLDLMMLFGIAAFSLYALRGLERVSGTLLPFTSVVAGASIGGILLSAVGLLSLAAGLAGTALSSPDPETLDILLFGTSNGTAWQLRIAALLAALASVWLLRSERSAKAGGVLAGIAGAVALATLAWGGHGAAGEGVFGWLRLVADVLHLLAAGVWVGALVAMLLLLLRPSRSMDRGYLVVSHRVLVGFSRTGTMVVGVLVVTGLINVIGLVGWPGLGALAASLYGQLLIAKLVLFGAMLALAASNRFRLVSRFERAMAADDHPAALAALRRSLAIETLCAIAVLALVAWLGTLDPSGAA